MKSAATKSSLRLLWSVLVPRSVIQVRKVQRADSVHLDVASQSSTSHCKFNANSCHNFGCATVCNLIPSATVVLKLKPTTFTLKANFLSFWFEWNMKSYNLLRTKAMTRRFSVGHHILYNLATTSNPQQSITNWLENTPFPLPIRG